MTKTTPKCYLSAHIYSIYVCERSERFSINAQMSVNERE